MSSFQRLYRLPLPSSLVRRTNPITFLLVLFDFFIVPVTLSFKVPLAKKGLKLFKHSSKSFLCHVFKAFTLTVFPMRRRSKRWMNSLHLWDVDKLGSNNSVKLNTKRDSQFLGNEQHKSRQTFLNEQDLMIIVGWGYQTERTHSFKPMRYKMSSFRLKL